MACTFVLLHPADLTGARTYICTLMSTIIAGDDVHSAARPLPCSPCAAQHLEMQSAPPPSRQREDAYRMRGAGMSRNGKGWMQTLVSSLPRTPREFKTRRVASKRYLGKQRVADSKGGKTNKTSSIIHPLPFHHPKAPTHHPKEHMYSLSLSQQTPQPTKRASDQACEEGTETLMLNS